MQIDDLISIVQKLIIYKGLVTNQHPDYHKFHDGITNFVVENNFDQTEEWEKIKSYLLIRPTQYMTNNESNIILDNLEELKRKVLRGRIDMLNDIRIKLQ